MLYSKAHFAVRHAASKDETRYNLNGVHFMEDGRTEATDGHMLIQVEAAVPEDGEFPCVSAVEVETTDRPEPFILPLPAADKLAKWKPKRKGMPVLENIKLDTASTNANGSARFVTTNLEAVDVTEARKIEGEFPNTALVIPEEGSETFSFGINLELLERVTKAVRDFKRAGGSKGALAVRVSGTDGDHALRIECDDPNVGKLVAVVMPMRLK